MISANYDKSGSAQKKSPIHSDRALRLIKCWQQPTLAPKDYHRPCGLYYRVRNGNGCVPARKATNTIMNRSGPIGPNRRFSGWKRAVWRPFDNRIGRKRRLVSCLFESNRTSDFIRPGRWSSGQPFISMVKPSAISTGPLKRSHALYAQPINLVVFQGPSSPEGEPRSNLGEGFALRCLQRLTFPGLATQRCP